MLELGFIGCIALRPLSRMKLQELAAGQRRIAPKEHLHIGFFANSQYK
jgi:hypothetical protein